MDAARLEVSTDGQVLSLAGRELTLLHTPGHARHHHCVWDAASRGWFTGDTFGLAYPEFHTTRGPWILPTSTPVQFEPEVLKASIARLLTFEPACMYLTHFGRVQGVPALAVTLIEQIDEMVAIGRRLREVPERHAALKAALQQMFLRRAVEHGCTLAAEHIVELLSIDLELNAQGLAIWLDKRDA